LNGKDFPGHCVVHGLAQVLEIAELDPPEPLYKHIVNPPPSLGRSDRISIQTRERRGKIKDIMKRLFALATASLLVSAETASESHLYQ